MVKYCGTLHNPKKDGVELSQNKVYGYMLGEDTRSARSTRSTNFNNNKIYWFLGFQGKGKRKNHLLFCLLWWLHSWFVMCSNLLLISSGQLTQLLCNKFHFVLRWTSNILFIFTAAFWLSSKKSILVYYILWILGYTCQFQWLSLMI